MLGSLRGQHAHWVLLLFCSFVFFIRTNEAAVLYIQQVVALVVVLLVGALFVVFLIFNFFSKNNELLRCC